MATRAVFIIPPQAPLEEPTCITPKSSDRETISPHSFGTPATHRGFLFRGSPEGSFYHLADSAQTLFSKAFALLETDLLRAQRIFSEAQELLPRISEVMPKELSGSDNAILSAVQKRALEIDAMIKTALTGVAGH